jgi:hypothetical protein
LNRPLRSADFCGIRAQMGPGRRGRNEKLTILAKNCHAERMPIGHAISSQDSQDGQTVLRGATERECGGVRGRTYGFREGHSVVTIAACYLSPEGVVLGADSASTYFLPSGPRHFNYGQKIFEIGEDSTLGIVTWGLGGLALGSHRTLAARLGDSLDEPPVSSVLDVANRWIDLVWPIYSALPEIQNCKALESKLPYDPAVPPDVARRTEVEELRLEKFKQDLVVGFCIGGYVLVDRTPAAFEMIFDPIADKPALSQLPMAQSFWGVPALINRLINGCG